MLGNKVLPGQLWTQLGRRVAEVCPLIAKGEVSLGTQAERERQNPSFLDPKDLGELPGSSDSGNFLNLPPHLQTISELCGFLAPEQF